MVVAYLLGNLNERFLQKKGGEKERRMYVHKRAHKQRSKYICIYAEVHLRGNIILGSSLALSGPACYM